MSSLATAIELYEQDQHSRAVLRSHGIDPAGWIDEDLIEAARKLSTGDPIAALAAVKHGVERARALAPKVERWLATGEWS